MSEPPRKTRSKRKDVQLVVSCEAPKAGVAEGRSTSVYEIDIQGGYILRNGKREGLEKALDEPYTKSPPQKLRGASQESAEKEVESPLFEAHYPKITETFSADQRPSRTQDTNFTVQREILADGSKEKDRKPFTGKANKKRQAMPTDAQRKFRKQIKNYIIENFIGDKSSEMKTMVQNYHGVLDGNEVHLHHHEHHHHHHHYYSNGKAMESEIIPQTAIKKNLNESAEIFVATLTTDPNEPSTENEDFEVENSHDSRCLCQPQDLCPPEEPPKASEEVPEHSLPPEEVPVCSRPSEEVCEEHRDSPLPEVPPSSDGLVLEKDGSVTLVKKTCPKNENNSNSSLKSRSTETDMIFIKNADCSVDTVTADGLENRGVKAEKNKSNKSYTSLVENFKSFSHFMSPIVITDQKTVPKILYIRCECSPWKGVATPEEAESFSRNESSCESEIIQHSIQDHESPEISLLSEEKGDPVRTTDDGGDQGDPESVQNSNSTSNQCHGLEKESSDELEFEVWTSKLKKELQEIKKELKRIEEKQVLEKRSTALSFRKDKLSEVCSEHQITVYSSKTFIVQPPGDTAANV